MEQILTTALETVGSLFMIFLLLCFAIAGLNKNRRD
jgi:hypothetical protein